VLLVEEAQDGMSYHNTWSLGISYGGINPYTLMARLGLIHTKGIGPPKR